MVDLDSFIRHGFVRLERPALRDAADSARTLLWRALQPSPVGPWTEPVVWTADVSGRGPFALLSGDAMLADALDVVCGRDEWLPRNTLGNIPVRFPVRPGAQDRGWHIDQNTPLPDGSWAVSGRPHTILMLTLLSEVGPDDAATRIRVGSHFDATDVLTERPRPATEVGPLLDAASAGRPVALATGSPGDVYLVHPFCVHAADEHRGATPRFMSQAPIQLRAPLTPQTPSPLAAVWQNNRD